MHKFNSLKQIVLVMCIFLCMVSLIAGVSALTDVSPRGSVTRTQNIVVHEDPYKIGSTSGIYINTNVPAPVANFVGTPTSGTAPLLVSFTDLSTNNPTGWAWYFGDETYLVPWMQITASPGWSARGDHTTVVLPDGSIVLMGGYSFNGNFKNDVWRSTDKGATWTQLTASAEWSVRAGHSSVVMPDGSIVLMGGGLENGSSSRNDVWRSTDKGATWTQMTASAGWSARVMHSSVVMLDGSIVLMGGGGSGIGGGWKNDVWRSTDKGATWTQLTASAEWSVRTGHTSVVMPDGSIVLMGGSLENSLGSSRNDVWRSTDNGATWTQMTASAEWTERGGHTSVVMPDGSIVLMGGGHNDPQGRGVKNDPWRSIDNGATWTNLTASSGPGWIARDDHTTIVVPDGSIVLMGGRAVDGLKNDVWRFQPVGSSTQNPTHTYTTPGIYPVALQAYNTGGYNSMRKTGYITVTGSSAPVASFTGTPTYGTAPLTVTFTDSSTGSPTSWSWSFGDGNISSVRNPVFTYAIPGNYTVLLTATNAVGSDTKTAANYITVNDASGVDTVGVFRNGSFYLKDATAFGYGLTGDSPIAGDWDGDGVDTGGVFRNGSFYLKDGPSFSYGLTGDKPVAGNWTGDRTTEVGVFRDGMFFLRDSTGGTYTYFAYGQAGDSPIAGDWTGDGTIEVGLFREGVFYLRDSTGGTYSAFAYGLAGDSPIAGDWNGDGTTEVGVFRSGSFYLRSPTGTTYDQFGYGLTGDTPIAGRWT
jgi:PKD repeat protein